ncbi:MAG: TadE/TadG family type IV pilus assembly protein, partial [Gemmatimonadota bacterium]
MSRFLLRAVRTVKRAEGGQSLIEFAIVLPVLLALVIGIFEFGRAWNVYQVITNAAREGARTAVVPTTESEDAVYAVIQNYFDRSALDGDLGTVTVDGFQSGVGQPLTVEIQYPYEFQFLGPIVAFLGDGSGTTPGSITLSTTAVMRNE